MTFESGFEQKMRRYKIVVFILTVFMIVLFFIFVSNIHTLIKKETPYILEECKWELKKPGSLVFVPESITNEKEVIEKAKELIKENYTFEVKSEYDECIGWVISGKQSNKTVEQILICKDGYVYHYDKICKKRGLIESLLEFFKMVIK